MKVTMRRAVLGTMMVWACVVGNTRTGWAAESSRFLVSYGGTAGYQLPLWVNKELGFSKKYGVDLDPGGIAEYSSPARG
jgi:ABC-type nitrate/sulfonate/bicarbonate transport system substrate-binding protein